MKIMNTYEERLLQLIKILKEFQPEKIYAYGSRAQGKAKAGSDIDVAVVVRDEVDTLDVRRKIALRLWETHYPYDLEPDVHVIPTDVFEKRLTKGDPFITSVAEGRLVYGL